MKKIFCLFLAVFAVIACTEERTVCVSVSNTTDINRNNEMVEISMEEIVEKLQLADTAQIVILNEAGEQVPYQITYDDRVIFPASVKANGQVTYSVRAGVPEIVVVSACGKQYPGFNDDVAWENDRIAFRTFGPALQAKGEKAYGYDIWVKNVEEPVLETHYANDSDPEVPDCYQAGPTLGGGTSALYIDDTIIYPYCYNTHEILDNGPLRFTVRLTYNPFTIKGDSDIVETRIVSLDKGSQLNKTVVSYTHIDEALPIVTGIVLHEPGGGKYIADAARGYIGYAHPGDQNNNNGTIYVGAVFPAGVKETKLLLFSENEAKERSAYGHILAVSAYQPDSEYLYYWGGGWSKYGFESLEAWTKYLDEFAKKVGTPLVVTVK